MVCCVRNGTRQRQIKNQIYLQSALVATSVAVTTIASAAVIIGDGVNQGTGATASGENAVAVGNGAAANTQNSVSIGNSAGQNFSGQGTAHGGRVKLLVGNFSCRACWKYQNFE